MTGAALNVTFAMFYRVKTGINTDKADGIMTSVVKFCLVLINQQNNASIQE